MANMSEFSSKIFNKVFEVVGTMADPYGIVKIKRELSESVVKKLTDEINTANQLSPADLQRIVSLISEYEDLLHIYENKALLRKYNNRMRIIDRASRHLKDSANPDIIDDGWILSFWDKSGLITDDALQEIWARILASQVNHPNTISRRLLHNLSLMSKQDAENFANLCRFCFDEPHEEIAHPLIYIKSHQYAYRDSRITTDILKELELFSLIETNYDVGFAFENKKVLTYLNHIIELTRNRIDAGNVRLTADGQRLYRVIEKVENEHIFEYTHERWSYNNCDVVIRTKGK